MRTKPFTVAIYCDSSYHAAGFKHIVEEYATKSGKKKKNTYALVKVGLHTFNATQ